jgi:hypothetical protein
VMPDVCRSEAHRILLVEGKTDCHVVLAIQQHYGLQTHFGIFACGSDDEVLKRLNALIPAPTEKRPERIGIVVDVDPATIADRWHQITDRLRNHGYGCPAVPDANGTVIAGHDDFPAIGVWLMPNNRDGGSLEDLLIQMADPNSIDFAREAVTGAQQRNAATFRAVHLSKAVLHTFLAWQDEPGRPPGLAITAAILRPTVPGAVAFAGGLQRLF